MANWKKVIVSGSSANLADLQVDSLTSGEVVIGGGSGNLSTTAVNGTGNIVATTNATNLVHSGSFSGSFEGSFTGTTNLPDLTQGTGIDVFTYDGSATATVAVSGASTLNADTVTKWTGNAFANTNITDDGALVNINSATNVTGSLSITGSQVDLYSTNIELFTDLFRVNTPDGSVNFLIVDSNGVQLFDTSGNQGVEVTISNRILYDSASYISVDWNNRQLIKSDGTTVAFDWENGQMTGSLTVSGSQVSLFNDTFNLYVDGVSILQAGVGSGVEIASSDGNGSFDSENRKLFDSASLDSVDWNNRQLIKSDGTTVSVDWENGLFSGSFSGSFQGNGSGLTNIPASAISGLNLNRIATGSVSASVDVGTNSFTIVSGSNTLLNLRNNGGLEHGFNVVASAPYSFAQGSSSLASGTGSFALGFNVTASGDYSVAFGWNNKADSSPYSFVHGIGNTVTGLNSHAEGGNNIVNGLTSHAEGQSNTIDSAYSHAEGQSNYLGFGANHSHAEGQANTINGTANFSHVEGGSNTVSAIYSHAEGFFTTTKTTATGSHAEGIWTITHGEYTHAEGSGSIASGSWSHAEGKNTIARGTGSHAEGISTLASGDNSHAEGFASTAQGSFSHAEGYITVASGNGAHAEGNNTSATNSGAHSEGANTTASGTAAHAEGSLTTAVGDFAHSEGVSTSARGANSHAEGSGSVSFGIASHAEGIHTIASGSGQLAAGRYNTQGNITSLVVIGNGTNDASRSDLALFNPSNITFKAQTDISGSLNVTGSNVYFKTDTFDVVIPGITNPLFTVDGASAAVLRDLNGADALVAGGRRLLDQNENDSVNWDNRKLYKSDGTTVSVDWQNGLFSGSFSGSFQGDGSQLTGLVSTLYISGSNGGGAVDLQTQTLTIAGTVNEIETSAAGQTITIGLPNDVTIGNNLTVSGDLIVNGTTTIINTTNTAIEDQFILLASGSTSTVDAGIIVQNAANAGEAFYWENNPGSVGRWAIASNIAPTATTVSAAEYMVTAITTAGAPAAAPTYGGSTTGYGNIHVNSVNGDIYIYA